MSPVDVASEAPDADAPRLCSASSLTKALASNVMRVGNAPEACG